MNVVSFLEMQHYGFIECIILSFMNVVSFLEMQYYWFSEWILLHVEMLMQHYGSGLFPPDLQTLNKTK
jgi:hypothetical protein